jgi:spermidine synthase
MTGWVEETLHADLHIKLRADRVLFDSKSAHQRLVLFENATFGRVLALDGVMQTTEKDEFIYHEMLAHLPILTHGRVRKVLIIGGGDGGMLEEVLKHTAVERVTMVDIDDTVIALSKRYLRSICGEAFEDPRTDLVIAEGTAFVADCAERYDLVIVDSTDPLGPGEALFSKTFYRDCKTCLSTGGVLVTQNGVPFLQGAELSGTMACLRPLFADVSCYLATVPTYVGCRSA